MSKSIKRLFTEAGDSPIKDIPVSGKKVMEMIGIDENKIQTPEDIEQVLKRLYSVSAMILRKLKTKASEADTINPSLKNKSFVQGINKDFERQISELEQMIKKYMSVKVGEVSPSEPTKAQDPRTGWADDPNPKTRGTQYPNRGFRSG